jgi:hypothetical protein
MLKLSIYEVVTPREEEEDRAQWRIPVRTIVELRNLVKFRDVEKRATTRVTSNTVQHDIGLRCGTVPAAGLRSDTCHSFVAFTVHVSTIGTAEMHMFRSLQHDTSCISTFVLVWEAITGIPFPLHQIECDAIIGKQTHQKG